MDGFVTRLDPLARTILYSTYLGGNGSDHILGIALDDAGRITVAGETELGDFPTWNAYDTTYAGGICDGDPCDDGFLTQLTADGSALRYSTYLGGSGDDQVNGVAVGPADEIYLTGATYSGDFPVVDGYDPEYGGGTCSGKPCRDAFLSQVDPASSGNHNAR